MRRFTDYLVCDFMGGPRPWKFAWVINFQKAGTFVFLLALIVRANLPLIVALQWISNPLTMAPIYFADYEIGLLILELFGVDYGRNKLLTAEFDWSGMEFADLWELVDTFPPMMAGGSVVGISLGVLAVFLYKAMAKLYKSPTMQSQ